MAHAEWECIDLILSFSKNETRIDMPLKCLILSHFAKITIFLKEK
jgi:hypothetical protein